MFGAIVSNERETMRQIKTMKALEDLGRVRLSENVYFREFLYSEIANFYGMPNMPDDPDTAIAAATGLCENLLEPLTQAFGKITIRSGYRSPSVNQFGNENNLNCARNEANRADHIYDWRDADGHIGATACIVVHAFLE